MGSKNGRIRVYRHDSKTEVFQTIQRHPEQGIIILRKTIIIILIVLTGLLLLPNIGISSAEQVPVPSQYDSSSKVLEAPIQVPKSYSNNCEQYRKIVEQYDWDVELVMSIMFHESSCQVDIVNNNPNTGDYSVGLMQINLYGDNAKYRPSEAELKNPATNIEFAYSLYKSSGFTSQWGVCRDKVRCF